MNKWTNINNQIPDEEVLAVNGQQEYLVGYIAWDEGYDSFICESDSVILPNVTHWMELPKIIEE